MVRKNIKKKLTDKEYEFLLLRLCYECTQIKVDEREVYPLLQTKINILDANFVNFINRWSARAFPRLDLDRAKILAASIAVLSKVIEGIPFGNKANNLEIAIDGYKIVSTVFTVYNFPEEWAQTQNHLGIAFISRITGDKVENVETALQHFEAALQIRTYDRFPEAWAETKVNQGVALVNRIKGDREENFEIAIKNYQEALEIYNLSQLPEKWATIQHNLGIALKNRLYGSKLENQEQAITAFTNALKVRNISNTPEQWADTQNCLGLIYWERIQGDSAENSEAAIHAFYEALKVYTWDKYLERWADIQGHLGIVHCDLRLNKAERSEKAILFFSNALKVFSRSDYPQKWAATQSDMGVAYSNQNDVNNAMSSFLLALEVFTPNTFPIECYQTGSNLGNIAFQSGLWLEAIKGYAVVIEAVETSRTWSSSESRRQEILEEAIDVYQNIVQACINAGQLEKAFEYAERWRSKGLVDLMASNDIYQGSNISQEVEQLLQQYNGLQAQIDQERYKNYSKQNRESIESASCGLTRADFQAYSDIVNDLEAQKQLLWQQIRRFDPILAGQIQINPLKFSSAQKLIDQSTIAILSFYTTNSCTYIFILRQNQLTLHTCNGQSINMLQSWIYQNWVFSYIDDKVIWGNQMQDFLEELAQRLEINDLIAQHLEGIEELILVPHLLLHQIPFAALPIGNNQYLVDKFNIRYTPSCQILEFCEQRTDMKAPLLSSEHYGIVEDTEGNLACAAYEGEQIANLYNIPLEKRLIGSQATCSNYQQLAKQVQVLHSCHHAQSRLDNPLESQLKLADGSITLGQLMSPGWRLPNLSDVFLSCCETNLGVPSLTDDIFTLSTGFLCAGARSVISSLWAVDDLATALFSIFYYEQRQKGENRSQALRKAQIKLREIEQEDLIEISKLAESRRKEARSKRSVFQVGSAEYLEWDMEYRKYAGVSNAIWNLKKSAKQFPFAHPRYWSAFICQGLQ